MIALTLPDGAVREFDGPVSGFDVAKSISSSLAKKSFAIIVNGEVRDLSREIDTDATIEIVTKGHDEVLPLIRHDCAHVMAEAVQELYPDTQVTIGPSIENGFYYDFARATPFTPDDLVKIEKQMHKIIERNEPIVREVWDRNEAIKFFLDKGEKYKAEIIRDLPETETITCYRQGDFIDLCRGPHAPSTGKIGKAFKLMKVAGAYWRGNSDNEMLQRIYGTCWESKEDLDAYLHMLEEAEKRDHRRLGREMDLFHMQEEAQGSVFWHDKGLKLYRKVENYIRDRLDDAGYQEVRTPQLVDRVLWEKSGHWEKFRENMFTTTPDEDDPEKVLALKPMNCPCHVQIFRLGSKSYRDLPLRMAEFGCCHRNEPSGGLHGIMRVRQFIQDDAHIFCTEDQIVSETKIFCDLLKSVYKDFGFTDILVKFSDRPEVRAGSDEIWDKAEAALREAAEEAGLALEINPGEGAFYGPKLEFVLRDAIGRDWQCGTLQADFVLPERLDASYMGEDGEKHRPVMLHRAILGSLERFIGILIENYAGRLPLWLSPVHAVICSITNEADDYAHEVKAALEAKGLNVELDLRNEKINYKVREHSHAKVPMILALGKREAEEKTASVRRIGFKHQKTFGIEELANAMATEIRDRVIEAEF
ncbi:MULTISPECIES: threonine--tRNA ligase [Thalassospira]|uniref:Threonine--tRNA ligase n=1 Tax=Thalassospira povalilytica TaxID=732237 RepID=A0A8I1SJR3_9PROT|nr:MULTISPECIES: threonine--tRNA ligase [Thalassospira]MEE3044699.1 threonine--tRNA ligase [Pseudomonadota bacterium]RCK27059.1 threonine--tRNA ligase [Thalassospira profundimaris]KZB60911.1 threonine--tRNA ligase [Thalassospira sp. MCCC 1A02491]MBN8197184.1 threonine--tRNA ligase [Thalassospira povalilytica]MBO6771181.1 threonine--tRNA ligase [Thalassospira sp.]|eukprot:TRINITY_DN2488_c0_g1_i1.p1 TRINITY_DN2488_c0_g1~~TRINITY_DN2488_c0_g1_i1.p1  ORF type:complete len:646 (+),score=113.52 TRINITY_DN2488_c0_g1_i1:1884-3821(+)